MLILFVWVFIANNDLYGRLSETKSLGRLYHTGASADTPVPTARIVLHRVLTDENAVAASVVLTMERRVWESFARLGVKSLRVVLHDGAPSSFQSFGLGVTATVAGLPTEQGLNIIGVESDRFRLSALPSVNGFPFDNIEVFAVVYLLADNGAAQECDLEVEKTLPGRLLRASLRGGTPWMVLTRSPN